MSSVLIPAEAVEIDQEHITSSRNKVGSVTNSEDMISQINIMWWILYGYYVMFMCGGQNSRFCKASLRICYISLFEYKGPWMLKTDISGHVRNRGLQN